MSFTFVTAARISMPRKGFDSWLDVPITSAAVIENPADTFVGWYWGDREGQADWGDTETDLTPRQLLAGRVAASCTANGDEVLTVLRYRDGALEAFLWTVGYSGAWETTVRRLLLMLAGAAEVKDDGPDDYVLFWEDAVGMLPRRDPDSPLALLAVSKGRVRFVGKRPLVELLAELKPAEDAFADLAEALDEDLDVEDPQDSVVPLDPQYVDPAVLSSIRPQYVDPAVLSSIRSTRPDRPVRMSD
ncbi:hypothetical protein [Micromonospora sp. NBC_01796]|uniref:hypothetical protein n=1 Tax=Micromonospora sp. NBC_01796 TaxID=2975987 RepID=UPI002DD8D531|nr:hypothetical protein [Micromonospora sp. NBC_01796]WSA85831.1 hypothetical protein OIE47_36735 [Micromonospora sp. NBC_01796]